MDMMNRDGIYHITLLEGQARAILIESTSMVQKAMDTHRLSRTATAALGRTITAAAMMGSMLKGDQESVSVQIKGGGPIGTVLAVAHGDVTVKGYVDNPDVDLPRMGKKLNVGGAVGKDGKMTVIKDMGMREPYIGQVNLVSGEIAEDFAMYFTASEQTPSLVSLGVLVDDTRVIAAGGLIVQMLPGASEAAIASVEHSVPMFADISATIQEYHLEGAVNQLLLHLQPEVLEKKVPQYRCDCSRERIEGMLVTLGSEELQDMIDTQSGAEVDCHFCLKRYKFNAEDLKQLLAAAQIREDQ